MTSWQSARSGLFPSFIMVCVNLLKNFHETGGAGVIHASAWRVIFYFVDAALGVDGVDYFARVRIHDRELARFVDVAALHAAANQQAMMRAIEGHGMRLRTARDGPGGQHLALVAVDDDHVARVSGDDVELRRFGIERQASGIQTFDFNAA